MGTMICIIIIILFIAILGFLYKIIKDTNKYYKDTYNKYRRVEDIEE